jgi:ectoine hydroxylase-related dioxygenase (phytanoyl-CoA dioxygenase family)
MAQPQTVIAREQGALRAQPPVHDLEAIKRTFDEDGFVIFRNVVSRERLSQLRDRLQQEFDRAKGSGALFSGGGLISGHLNCFPGEESRFVYETLEQQGIIDVVKALFPKATRLPNVGCNFNLPNSVAQHYHMDRNFLDHFMIANVAVVDTDLTNGAIDLVPGTHKKFYKFWRFAVERPHRASKRVPMKQGDVMVRTSNVWHRGMPNHTAVARPMLAYTWEDGGTTQGDPFKQEGGKIVFRQNWYRPDFLGRLRERTFVTAPLTYSAYRFVGSLFDGSKGYDHH